MKSRKMDPQKLMTVLLLCIWSILLSFANASAYTPPIGIPDPGMWGVTHPIDSSAPNTATKCPSWPAGQTTNCYYIDNTSPQATDTSNTYGYPAKPRSTIPTAYAAGSYIEMHGGPYTVKKTITFNGTAENPIWMRGTSSTSMPDLRMRAVLIDSKYVIMENLEFNNFPGNAITIGGLSTNNVCIRNCKFHDLWCSDPNNCSTAVIESTPAQDGSIHDLVFYNNSFQDIGDYQATNDQDFHAINPTLWGRKPPTTQYNVWSLNNTAIRIAGSLNQFNGDQRDAYNAANEVPPRPITNTNLQNFHHMYSGKNLMYQSRQAMGAPKFTTDAVYSQNTAYDNYSISSSAGTGQAYQEGSRYVWILFNKYYNLTFGVRSSNTNFPGVNEADLRAYIIGNIIYDLNNDHNLAYLRTNGFKPVQAVTFERGGYKRYIVDNTFYNVGGGISINNQNAADITDISGNVFANVNGVDRDGNPDYHLFLNAINGTTGTTINHCYLQPRADNGTVTFKWAGALPSSNIDSLVALQSSSVAQCQNCWTGDPKFVDVANYDFHPQENSPLIGKGIRHPVYDEFQARYGINIAYDFEGKPRPADAWTLGALEPGTLKGANLPTPPFPTPTSIK